MPTKLIPKPKFLDSYSNKPISQSGQNSLKEDFLKQHRSPTFKESLSSLKDNPMDIIDIPQKALVYGVTALTRGLDNAEFTTPSTIVRSWNLNNNIGSKVLENVFDYTLDPTNLIPYAKGKAAIKIGTTEALSALQKLYNASLKGVRVLDNVQDTYTNGLPKVSTNNLQTNKNDN